MTDPDPQGALNENHERHLLASCQYAAKLLRECEEVLTASENPPALPRYAGRLSPLEQKVTRDYLQRLQQQLVHVLAAVGITPPPPNIDAVRALRAALTAVDITFEEMRGRHMGGYGAVPPERARLLDGLVTEVQGMVRDLDRVLVQTPDETLRARVDALPGDHPYRDDLRRLERIVTTYALIELRQALVSILDRTLDPSLEIAVFGRVSSGKSSLLNQLLGAQVLPVGVLPVTAVPTRLRAGPAPRLLVTNSSGREDEVAIDRIAEFATEEHNPGNTKRLTRLVVEYPGPHLPEGVTFVDTPGLGSLATAGAVQTLAYLPRCDRGTLLVDASAPLADQDVAVLRALQEAGISTSVLLSKADLLTAADVSRVQRYVARQLEDRLGLEVTVRAVSAVPAHRALLAEWIAQDVAPLAGQARAGAEQALARKVRTLAARAASALEHRAPGGNVVDGTPPGGTAIEARIRDVGSRLEEMARDLDQLPDLAPSLTAKALADATAAFVSAVERRDDHERVVEVVRSAVIAAGHDPVAAIVDQLLALERDAHAVLAEAAEVAAMASAPREQLVVAREVPPLDLPTISLVTVPPAWTSVGHSLRANWAERHLRERCADRVHEAMSAHLHVLRAWARSTLAGVRRYFDGESRPLLAQLSAVVAAPSLDGAAVESLGRDLAWLREVSRRGVPSAPNPPPRPAAPEE